MTWRIEISQKDPRNDVAGQQTFRTVQDLGLKGVRSIALDRVYNLTGDLSAEQVEKICRELLADPVTHSYRYSSDGAVAKKNSPTEHTIEIAYNPGVMDPVEHSTLKGIEDLGIAGVEAVHTARRYRIEGRMAAAEKDLIINKVLSNKIVEHEVDRTAQASFPPASETSSVEVIVQTVDLLQAGDAALKRLSADGQLFLNLDEMKTIQKHFQSLKRNPTDIELETIAQTWSEHCFHKTFRGNIRYTWTEKGQPKTKIIKNLLKSTIVKATEEINKPWCISVFHDNAGVIAFDQDHHICFKVETHNHPSALEPFGGANTGIGGVIRDILGTGLGAKPFANTDVFCFAPPDMPADQLPPGTLHPKRVMKGVVSGVRDYGNKMGIPTVNGAVLFDPRFVGNPLVYCGTVGLIPKDCVKKKVGKGDLIVAMGGRTGRDGIHGATFSSGELTTESEVVSSGAVQIGHPIQEKKVADALLQARDEGLYTALTDCGAGGFSSAVGEMGEKTGARVDLESVPLKYQGLKYWEIWISESQERMVLSVPPKHLKRLQDLCAKEHVEVSVIGEFTGSGRLELFHHGRQVCDLEMEFLHNANPRITKDAVWKAPVEKAAALPRKPDFHQSLLKSLGHFNVCSKEWIIRQYDHEVQGGSVIKPLVGVNTDGPSDAAVVLPKLGQYKGVAISNGINFRYGELDPYWMAASCIDEALRQIIAVGGDRSHIAILDNFCWGNPDKPDRLGSLVRAAQGCYKAAVALGVPFISGKDSLYNEYTQGRKSIAIPGTLLISAVGVVADVRKCVTMDLKSEDSLLYMMGETYEELGGSIYLDVLGKKSGGAVPQVRFPRAAKSYDALTRAIGQGLVRSAHDCSEGGFAVAIAEMAFAGGIGADVDLTRLKYKGENKAVDAVIFSESNSRILLEVDPRHQSRFEAQMKTAGCHLIGRTIAQPELVLRQSEKTILKVSLQELKDAWQRPLNWSA